MDLNYPSEEYSKSWIEESDQSSDDVGSGRSYECMFCKRGFTTAQALGGHMNIHRKERGNKTKPNFPLVPPPPSTSNKVDADLPSHLVEGNYSTAPGVDANSNPQVCFPSTAGGIIPSHVKLCVENQRDWRNTNLRLYTNPFFVHEIKDKFEEDGLDLELRLGHHP
ncbi:hypothetical protein VNO77_17390 [Canavalia gladiata]|uniref:C2H2-type domain-containing protein n=1 Tax=Canavalia gladiata TaxID=3824 RepID=A0AAN9LIW5_CANGL